MNSLIKKVSCMSPPVVIGEIPRHGMGEKNNFNELKITKLKVHALAGF